MAQVVKPYIRQPCTLQERFKRSVVDVVPVQGRADLRGEYQALILVESAHSYHLFSLPLAVPLDSFDSTVGKSHGAAALGSLRGCEGRSVLGPGECPAYAQGSSF